ncbi:MAG: Uma2 family endonuclease, partial [candidate division KSB1 bacterium]|nr:Uma2 family endonuclease [candidate division KSB1 bacterium]
MELTVELEKPEALAVPGYMTEEEFVAWCDEDVKAEYVDGEVIVHSPAALNHESVVTFLGGLLLLFIDKNKLGMLFSATNAQIR